MGAGVDIGVVIPVYNHLEQLPLLVQQVLHHFPVIVVDDGSSVEVSSCLQGTKVDLVRHSQNLGKGRALETGLIRAYSKGWDWAITLDADGQHLPEALSQWRDFLKEKRNGTYVVVGVRKEMGRRAPWRSRLGFQLAGLAFWLTTGHFLADTQCGFRAYPVRGLVPYLPLQAERFGWETEILLLALRKGWQIHTLPVPTVYPPERISHYRPLADTWAVAKVFVREVFSRSLG